jgi:uncharacterized protein (DUF305 family)
MPTSRIALVLSVLLGACAGPAAPAAAPAPHTHPAAPETSADTMRHGYSEADVRFMQGMIMHHGQALEMAALVPARTPRSEIRLIAQRIEVSQQDEIAMMQRWLRDRGEEVPSAEHHHHEGMAMMPGMLTPEQMQRLAGSSGPEFDRLFLEGMIQHHQGALEMVRKLFATPGAVQEPQIYQFASDVDADQRAEIARMRAVLNP